MQDRAAAVGPRGSLTSANLIFTPRLASLRRPRALEEGREKGRVGLGSGGGVAR